MSKILIVDDDQLVRAIIARIASSYGHDESKVVQCDSVSSAKIAIRESLEPGLRLCIIDFHLGDGTGSEIVSEIKKVYPDTRVIVLSGTCTEDEEEEVKQKSIEAGANIFSPKNENLHSFLENEFRMLV